MPREPKLQSGARGVAQLFRLVHRRGLLRLAGRETRQDRRQRARAEGAALRHLDRCRQRLGQIGEQGGHFGAGLEAVLGRELAALAVGDQAAFGDAQQRIVRLVILARGEVRLVGRHQRNATGIGKLDQVRLRDTLSRHAMPLQLDIEPVAEQPLQFLAARQRQRALTAADRRVQRPVRSAAERNEAVGLVRQPGKLDVRLFRLLGAEIGARAEPHQAAIAVLAGGQEHDPRKPLPGHHAAIVLIAEIEAERTADDRLDARARHFLGEFERAEHVVGVGQRQRRLLVFLRQLRQPRDGQRAFEQRIGRMNVQMHEAGCRGSHVVKYSRRPILREAKMRAGMRRSPSLRTAPSPLRTGCWPRARSAVRTRAGSNDAEHLRPHGDHGQEQRDRSQRQSFFSDRANHDVSPLRLERIGNIVH